MKQEELKQRLIELLDIAVGDSNITESEVKIVANYLIDNGVTIRERGDWVKRGCKWQCTQCKVLMDIDGTPEENLLNFCPHCGADMRGVKDE